MNAELPTYQVSFDRIGRDTAVEPLTVQARDADALAEKVYAYARPHLLSRDISVDVDLEAMSGIICAGIRNGGQFTIRAVESAGSGIRPLTTTRGRTVRVGQRYRDKRDSNVRTLRVDGFVLEDGQVPGAEPQPWHDAIRVACTVIAQEFLGVITEPNRPTKIAASSLTGPRYVLIDEPSEL